MGVTKLTIFFAYIIGYITCDCIDIDGYNVPIGIHFIPGPDKCLLCVCNENNSPKWCKKVLCTPPDKCKSFIMGNSCCDFVCTDTTLVSDSKDDVDRKFLISVTTAFFILTLMFFIISKLWHRGIMRGTRSRRTLNDRRNLSNIGFITSSVGYLNIPNEHQFDDNPINHFSVYKPHCSYFPPGEAPPPYDEAVAGTPLNAAFIPNQISASNYTESETSNYQLTVNTTDRDNDTTAANNDSNNGNNHNTPINNINESYRVEIGAEEAMQENQNVEENGRVSASYRHTTIPLMLRITNDMHDEQSHNTDRPEPSCRQSYHSLTGLKRENSNDIIRSGSKYYIPKSSPLLDVPLVSKNSHSNIAEDNCHFSPRAIKATLSAPLPSTSSDLSVSSTLNCTSFASSQNLPKAVFPESRLVSDHGSVHKCKGTKNNEGDRLNISSAIAGEFCTKKHVKRENCKKSVKKKTCNSNNSSNANVTVEMPLKPSVTSATAPEKDCNITLPKETNKLIQDYHAECENCNLTVANETDIADVVPSEQVTMTLQRHINDVKNNAENLMKVSHTLPTNTRNKREMISRCKVSPATHGKIHKKNGLENVSSGDEDESKLLEKSKVDEEIAKK